MLILSFPKLKPSENLIRPSDYRYIDHNGQEKAFDMPFMFGVLLQDFSWHSTYSVYCSTCKSSWLSDGPTPKKHVEINRQIVQQTIDLYVREIVFISCGQVG